VVVEHKNICSRSIARIYTCARTSSTGTFQAPRLAKSSIGEAVAPPTSSTTQLRPPEPCQLRSGVVNPAVSTLRRCWLAGGWPKAGKQDLSSCHSVTRRRTNLIVVLRSCRAPRIRAQPTGIKPDFLCKGLPWSRMVLCRAGLAELTYTMLQTCDSCSL